MNISHNYSGLSEEKNSRGIGAETQHYSDTTPPCLDEESLRALINIPSAMFLSKPESSD